MNNLDSDVYEVFAQPDSLSPHVHVFNVQASSPEMALALAEENFFRRAEFVSLWVVRRDHVHQLGFSDRDGFQKTAKPYRTTDDYKYLRDKWRYYREHPMRPGDKAT
jgi:ring-1,2-phenylacetyl-CoA epoxidase subunit PaaB